jgi:hypothetical protein
MSITPYTILLILVLAAITWRDSSCFTIRTISESKFTLINGRYHLQHRRGTILRAKKVDKTEKATSSSGGGGSGFGAKVLNISKQIRSVSGHRGGGERSLRQAANIFDEIRKQHGARSTNDVYCRSPLNEVDTFWFVGKIAVRPNTTATPEQAILSQKRLILEYAKRELRPQNLAGKYSSGLEVWLAPGDSEMDAVQNKISLYKVEGSSVDIVPNFSVKDVGFNPEIYVGDERENGGLRIKRDEKGNPVKPVFDVKLSS